MNKFFSLPSARVVLVGKQAAFAAIGATVLSLYSMTASAQLPPPQQRVDFEDLDLTKAQDTERLYRRLRFASQAVCSEFMKAASVRMRERGRECIAQALTQAVETISHPSLTALHASKNDMQLAQRRGEASPRS
jgi:UrcA family protein